MFERASRPLELHEASWIIEAVILGRCPLREFRYERDPYVLFKRSLEPLAVGKPTVGTSNITRTIPRD